jgi:hypothetical protein
MCVADHDHFMQRAAEVSAEPYLRLRESADKLYEMMMPYLQQFGAPEEEVDRLIGHNGLKGETGNSLGQWLAGIYERFYAGEAGDRDGILQRAFFLSVIDRTHSKYSRHGAENTHENVIAACNRVIDDIGHWADKHMGEIDSLDRLKILNERHNFARALDQIYEFVQFSKEYFATHDITPHIPPRYLQAIQQEVAAYDMEGP